jgi:hypothetical protein
MYRIDAKIGRDRFRALPGEARPRRDGEPVDQRHDEIGGHIGDRALMAADALAQFAAQAKPVDRVIFGEPAELERSLDVAQAAQLGMILAVAGRNEFRRRTDPKVTEIDQRNASTVARAAKLGRRAGAANRKDQLPERDGSTGRSNGGAGSVNAVWAAAGSRPATTIPSAVSEAVSKFCCARLARRGAASSKYFIAGL